MIKNFKGPIIVLVLALGLLMVIGIPYMLGKAIQQTTSNLMNPVVESNNQLKTQVSELLNPTPTIIPDPVTIVHEVRALARLETIQFVEKAITAESGQGQLGFLFGDKLLFVAHGTVIAGVDMGKLSAEDLKIENEVLYVRLPEPEIFTTTLNNSESYVYDRQTGLLSKGDTNLESAARKAAEDEIYKAAIKDGILKTARANAEIYLSRLFASLGYKDVVFVEPTPAP